MNTINTVALALALLSLSTCAFANLWVHDSFTSTTLNSVTNTPAGGSGWQTDSAWIVSNSFNSLSLSLVDNLDMGRLMTTGQALRVSNPNQSTGYLERGIDITPPSSRSSFWTSYLVQYEGPTTSGTYQYHQGGWSFRKATDATYTFASIFLHAGEWDSTLGCIADVNGKDGSRADWLVPPVSGTTYLVVTAVTNLYLPSWSGSESTVLRQWVLDSDDFAAVVDSGLLDSATSEATFAALLNGHSRAIIQESQDGEWGTDNLNANDRWRFAFDLRNYNPPHATYTLDELRLGASFVDVLPLLPPPPAATVFVIR